MSNRTWVCLDCKKSYRRPLLLEKVPCALCGQPCEYVHHKLRIPSPRKQREWTAFWAQYLSEKRLLTEFRSDPTLKVIELPLLNQTHVKAEPKRNKPAAKWKKRPPRKKC